MMHTCGIVIDAESKIVFYDLWQYNLILIMQVCATHNDEIVRCCIAVVVLSDWMNDWMNTNNTHADFLGDSTVPCVLICIALMCAHLKY